MCTYLISDRSLGVLPFLNPKIWKKRKTSLRSLSLTSRETRCSLASFDRNHLNFWFSSRVHLSLGVRSCLTSRSNREREFAITREARLGQSQARLLYSIKFENRFTIQTINTNSSHPCSRIGFLITKKSTQKTKNDKK